MDKIIDKYLNGNGKVIIEAAKKAGLNLALACALVEIESDGRNIFGCDGRKDTGGKPPYCREPVTKERVKALLKHIEGGGISNGVGLTQLTYPPFIREAEALGGAHIPYNQCEVGFKILAGYLNKYPYTEALAAYNAGEGGRMTVIATYAAKLARLHAKWIELLKPVEEAKDVLLSPDVEGYLFDGGSGKYVSLSQRINSSAYVDEKGYVWTAGKIEHPLKPVIPNGSWIQRHPTRYLWRKDVHWLVQSLLAQYNCSINTYVDHPEGWGRKLGKNLDVVSFDCWHENGRGIAIPKATGDAIVDRIFGDPNPPRIDWCIWYGYIWSRHTQKWEVFKDDGTGKHYDHPHFTMV